MSKQISIRWDSGMGDDYDVSVAALGAYRPLPDLTVSVKLKGSIPEAVLAKVVNLAEDNGLEINVTLTATWADEESFQLRLFPPPVPIVVDAATGEILDEAERIIQEEHAV